jgi:hypothetical protein
MKTKKLYYVGVVCSNQELNLGTRTVNLKVCWADGMIGALAVFTNKKKAKSYAGEYPIFEVACLPVKEKKT